MAHTQKLADKLCFAQSAVTGRIGRGGPENALQIPIRPRRDREKWRSAEQPNLATREIAYRCGSPPDRIYSDTAGIAHFLATFPQKGSMALPILMAGCVGDQPIQPVRATNTSYISKYLPRRPPKVQQLTIASIESDAARSAPTESPWATAAKYGITLWVRRVPPKVSPADAPSKSRQEWWLR